MATQTQTPVKEGSEKKLWITQQGIVEDAPGGVPAHLSFGVLNTVPDPVNPGDVTFALKAPTGFAFTGWLSWAYHDVNTLQAKGNLKTTQGTLGNGGRTLTFTHNPSLSSNQECLGYAAQVTAIDGASPGRYTDGELRVGTADPVKLKGRVLDPDED
ncbi:hypothetical protein [Streptomyces naphthomycinicus]|uniref:hypothetical protein n=1 Tax=Streptomyces naphthomycinicus TaxID=2872625 RepID=UPI001CED28FC|nr:hypothetical protein [Streptomyces sp. TML10]